MQNLESMHQKAMSYYEEKKLNEALSIYLKIIEYNPIDEVALSCVMDIYSELDDKFNYYLSRANVNIAQNKIEYAINDTKKALEMDLENAQVRKKLARLYRADNKGLKAIDEFLKVLEISPSELDTYFELVDLYMKEKAIESAISIAKQGLEHFPDNADLKNMLAQLYFRANDFKNALDIVEDEFLRIKILLQDEQNDTAKAALDKINPDTLNELQKRNYYVLKAQYLYNTNEYKESLNAIEEYNKISKPDAVSFQMKALNYEELKDLFNAHLCWGFCAKLRGKFDDAIVEFENAYRENNNDKTVLIELAKLYWNNKERFVAMEYWQKVYEIDKDEEARKILADFYYSEGNYDKAREYGMEKEEKNKKSEPDENYVGLIDKIMGFFAKK